MVKSSDSRDLGEGERGCITVVDSDVSKHPKCVHGPTLLFERTSRKGGVKKRFFGCSGCRDRKACDFFCAFEDVEKRRKAPPQLLCLAGFEPGLKEALEKQTATVAMSHVTLCTICGMCPSKKSVCNISGLSCQPIDLSFDGLSEPCEETSGPGACFDCGKLFIFDDCVSEECSSESHDLRVMRPVLSDVDLLGSRRTANKKESQFIFDDPTLLALEHVFARAGMHKLLFIGCPSLYFKFRRNDCCFLLDFDERFHLMCEPTRFSHFNAFNGYFFHGDKPFGDWLKKDSDQRAAIVVDMPFGGRIDALARVLRGIRSRFANVARTFFFLVLPYFMERTLLDCLPELRMMDLRMNYSNHKKFNADSNRGSPVRVFTDLPADEFDLSGVDGYKFCKSCAIWVYDTNKHCPDCDACTTKDGATYVHCKLCAKCVKPSWDHCAKCGFCVAPSHTCKRARP